MLKRILPLLLITTFCPSYAMELSNTPADDIEKVRAETAGRLQEFPQEFALWKHKSTNAFYELKKKRREQAFEKNRKDLWMQNSSSVALKIFVQPDWQGGVGETLNLNSKQKKHVCLVSDFKGAITWCSDTASRNIVVKLYRPEKSMTDKEKLDVYVQDKLVLSEIIECTPFTVLLEINDKMLDFDEVVD